MSDHEKKSTSIWTHVIIGFLSAILLVVLIWFGFDVFRLYRTGVVGPAFSRIHRRTATPTLTADQIQGWMTFRYVNYIFHLPADYLKTKLNITDSNYPNITIDTYASTGKLSVTTVLQSISEALASYTPSTSP